MGEKAAMTWQEVVDTCSRLHTTRHRPLWSGGPHREDPQMIDVTVDGRPAQIVPTRMHEPGFYWRYMDVEDGTRRSDEGIEELRRFVDAGLVVEPHWDVARGGGEGDG